MGLGITEDKIAKAHVFLHQAAKVYTHLLGVFVYKTKALGFGLGPVVALGTLKDKRHERIILADIAEKLQTGIRTLLTSESISTMLGLSLCFHLIAKGLGGTLQRETGIADDTKSIVGILVIEFLSFFVSTSQNHLGSTTHTHGGSMTVQCLLGEVLALFQYVIVEIGKNGTVEADGVFDPKINLNSLGEVDVTGLPDFLDDDDVVADLDNPQILLTVNNDMDVAATVSATVISTKEGRELARVTLPEMSVAKNGLSKICICRQKTSELTQQYGEANVYAVSNLSTLINRIPDHIKIVDVNAHAKAEVATIVFGEEYHVKPSYKINAPLAFGEKANIVYEDSFTGWNDDIDELDLAEGTYIEVTANVENKVPAYLTVKAYPVDAQGNKIEDKLLIEIPDEVAASTDGTTAVTTPITMKITPKVKNSLKQLDGLVFRLEGSAKSANGNKVTGISLNERKHTLKLNDIKVKIVGKIIGDFN